MKKIKGKSNKPSIKRFIYNTLDSTWGKLLPILLVALAIPVTALFLQSPTQIQQDAASNATVLSTHSCKNPNGKPVYYYNQCSHSSSGCVNNFLYGHLVQVKRFTGAHNWCYYQCVKDAGNDPSYCKQKPPKNTNGGNPPANTKTCSVYGSKGTCIPHDGKCSNRSYFGYGCGNDNPYCCVPNPLPGTECKSLLGVCINRYQCSVHGGCGYDQGKLDCPSGQDCYTN